MILNLFLSMCLQVSAEFHRITNVNLHHTFYAELDRHTQKLIGVYREKVAEALRQILGDFDSQVSAM